MVCGIFYYGLKGTDVKIVFVKTVVPMVIIVGIISYFFKIDTTRIEIIKR